MWWPRALTCLSRERAESRFAGLKTVCRKEPVRSWRQPISKTPQSIAPNCRRTARKVRSDAAYRRSTVFGRDGTTEVKPDGFNHDGARFQHLNLSITFSSSKSLQIEFRASRGATPLFPPHCHSQTPGVTSIFSSITRVDHASIA